MVEFNICLRDSLLRLPLLEHPQVRKSPVMLLAVQSVSDHETVFD
jgi:hypothetical protein